jgi:hypothetical protein
MWRRRATSEKFGSVTVGVLASPPVREVVVAHAAPGAAASVPPMNVVESDQSAPGASPPRPAEPPLREAVADHAAPGAVEEVVLAVPPVSVVVRVQRTPGAKALGVLVVDESNCRVPPRRTWTVQIPGTIDSTLGGSCQRQTIEPPFWMREARALSSIPATTSGGSVRGWKPERLERWQLTSWAPWLSEMLR